ncbi:MAG TPA: DUF1877 family protein [Chloroflexia bacterium]|nr:DUF1877 family protein [Chloroflexia bacterium]
MSMTGNLKQITPQLLSRLLNNNPLALKVLYPELYSPQDAIENLSPAFSSEEDIPKLDLGPDFYIIHLLLTTSEEDQGEASSAFAIFGKTPLGEISDYGPLAQYLTPEEVKEIASDLITIPKESLKEKYNSTHQTFEDYSFDELQESELDVLLQIYERIVDYYKVASEKGNSMLCWIT